MKKNNEFMILVVDDDPDMLRITERLLKEQNYTIRTAVDGQTCLQSIRQHKPDLLLLDVMLPDMSGIDICKTIKKDPQLSSIFVFLLSGMKTQSENISEGLETGADGYLIKPLQKREFLARIDAAFRIIRAEKTLREAEEKYRSLLEGSILGILAFDIDTHRCSFSNPAACKLFGYDEEEICRLNLPDFHPKDLIEEVINEFKSQWRGEKSISNELPCLRKDGTIFYADIAGHSTVINGRNCNIGFIMDVTERRQAEESLLQTRLFLDSIIEHSPNSMWISDEHGTLIRLNQACRDHLHLKDDEVLGKYNIFKDNLLEEQGFIPMVKNVFEKGVAAHFTIQYDTSAVNNLELEQTLKVFLDVHISPIVNSHGKVTNAIIQHIDITERKHVEEELARQKNFFEQMFMQSSVSTQILDREGWCERINPKLSEIFGVEPHNIEGRVYNIFQDEAIKQGAVIPHLERAFHEGKAAEWEILFDIGVAADSQDIEVKDKKKVWYHNWAYPIFDKNGNISHVIIQHHNITERKQMISTLEEALVKAEAGNRLKKAFMNNISHEIRTPLNGILGFSSLMTQPDSTEEEKEQFYSLIQTSSHRLLNTVTSFMDISLIASGTMEVKRKSIDLHRMLHQFCDQFQPLCATKNIELHLQISDKTQRVTFHSDEELLRKILSHILDNAVKFTHQGRITFGYVLKSGSYEFYVKDTGIGIGQESLSVIFESFIQEELSPTRGYEGSGLGLSIAHGLIRLLGGEMRVESEKGIGSTFFFTIPHEGMKETFVKPESEKTAVPVLEKPVILIAEDDESNRFYLEKILTKRNVKVLSATDGIEAMEQCRAHPEISLVLMDLKMPVMDGFEATHEIKIFRKDLPIIALTAFAMSGDKKRALEAGCNDYLSKPVTRAVLFDKLKKYGVRV
jgi:PAS domain S-box-containing protein